MKQLVKVLKLSDSELMRKPILGIYNNPFVDPKQTAQPDPTPQRLRAGTGRFFPLCSIAHESIREKSSIA